MRLLLIGPGIRLLDGVVTDAMEASALTYNMHFIDIYVCSWGPRDTGAEMDGPHRLTERALRLGTQKARLSFPKLPPLIACCTESPENEERLHFTASLCFICYNFTHLS